MSGVRVGNSRGSEICLGPEVGVVPRCGLRVKLGSENVCTKETDHKRRKTRVL